MDAQQSVSQAVAASPLLSQSDISRPKRHRRWIWVLVLVALALLFAAVVAYHTPSVAAAQQSRRSMMGPVPVTTATAKLGNIKIYLDAIGTVTPVYTDTITAR
jgi:multidrug efflux system membrane fusion protein